MYTPQLTDIDELNSTALIGFIFNYFVLFDVYISPLAFELERRCAGDNSPSP
jgi:hypothetical protein